MAVAKAEAIGPLVSMLMEDKNPEAPVIRRLAAMILVRLANHSDELVDTIVKCGGIIPFVKLLQAGTAASKQMAAQGLAAIARVAENRDIIVDDDAIKPLIQLLSSQELGTPEAAALALANLSRSDGETASDKDEGQTASMFRPPKPSSGAKYRHASIK